MKNLPRLLLVFLALIFCQSVRADIVLEIHGYKGSVMSWERSGVNTVLDNFGWKRAFVLLAGPAGLIPMQQKHNKDAEKLIVNFQLNTELPLIQQANAFTAALRWVNDRFPGESIIIVGHSLGGVVARLSLVRDGAPGVVALVTIASPHFGTALAYRGLDEVDDPFPINWLKELLAGESYDVLNRSRHMLRDILPALPGRLLYWLNSRVHPDIEYFSIVRSRRDGSLGDEIVPGYSQDMRNIPAIKDKTVRLIEGFQHALGPLDGYELVNIFEQLR